MASAFKYLTPTEYASHDLSVSSISDTAKAEAHISAAERLIDAYVGPWPSFYPELPGTVTAVSGAVVTASVFGGYSPNYWAAGGLYVHVFEGGGAGSEGLIESSSGQTATLTSAIAGLAVGSRFVLRQESVFPRFSDVDAALVPFIPKRVKAAVAAQVAFSAAKGTESAGLWAADAITGDRDAFISETYGSGYSYQRDVSMVKTDFKRMIAPHARALLRGYLTRTGRLVTGRRG